MLSFFGSLGDTDMKWEDKKQKRWKPNDYYSIYGSSLMKPEKRNENLIEKQQQQKKHNLRK